MGRIRHGYSSEGGPLYRCWLGINRRCYNKNDASYKNYGGRGIFMCNEWRGNFPAFMDWAINNGWEEGLTIERKNVDDGYSPQNCTWATRKEQSRNKRNSRLIEYNGQKLIANDWAEITNIGPETIVRRIYERGWSIERALTTSPESPISSNKITEDDVLRIFNSDDTAHRLSKKYKICRGAVWAIWRGATWSHITGKVFVRKNKYPKRRKKSSK